ncbi:MAG: hypothetical protein PHF87_11200 [Desulfotomaculaceae bacterium]|nr:hypothetical protein [Desulfotomaculaceae bacterium]
MNYSVLRAAIRDVQIQDECTDVVYPRVSGLGDDMVEDRINRRM